MNVNHFVADITDQMAAWGVNYSENVAGLKVGTIDLEVSDGDDAARITNGEELLAITSDADKAAAILTFPLARKAWAAGYMGDFEIDTLNGEMDMRLSYGSDGVTISAPVDSDSEFIVTEHPLFRNAVTMTDLDAVLESTELAYQHPSEAWQVLCNATDFKLDDWGTVVEHFHWYARFDHGDRLTKVYTCESDNVALVEDCGPESPVRVIDVDTVSDVACWSQSDIAAAILCAIS